MFVGKTAILILLLAVPTIKGQICSGIPSAVSCATEFDDFTCFGGLGSVGISTCNTIQDTCTSLCEDTSGCFCSTRSVGSDGDRVISCQGTVTPCSALTDAGDCRRQGCDWDSGEEDEEPSEPEAVGDCQGTPREFSCSASFTTFNCFGGLTNPTILDTCNTVQDTCESICGSIAGCACARRSNGEDITISCEGSVIPCASLTDSDDCRNQSGCSWVLPGDSPPTDSAPAGSPTMDANTVDSGSTRVAGLYLAIASAIGVLTCLDMSH